MKPLLRATLVTMVALLPIANPAFAVVDAAEITPDSSMEEATGRVSSHSIPRTDTPMKVDGRLDEAAWAQALSLSLDHETRPGENTRPAVETECLLTFDDEALYVAFRAFDSEPKQIRARLADRDTARSDDFVGIVVDTFNDQRHAFEFFVNPLGVQMDLFNDGVNNNETVDLTRTNRGVFLKIGYDWKL